MQDSPPAPAPFLLLIANSRAKIGENATKPWKTRHFVRFPTDVPNFPGKAPGTILGPTDVGWSRVGGIALPAPGPRRNALRMESREEELVHCVRRLLDSPELRQGCEETRAAIDDALSVLSDGECNERPGGEEGDEAMEFCNTVLYIGEQVELIRTVLDRLCQEVGELKKALGKEGKQKRMF